jgi:hypothetical protein
VMFDRVDEVDVGEPSRGAMVACSRCLVALRLSCSGEVATRWSRGRYFGGCVALAREHCQTIRAARKLRPSQRVGSLNEAARLAWRTFEVDEAPCSKAES